MARLPQGQSVDRAFKLTGKELKSTIKQLNRHAGGLLAKGQFEKAEEVVKFSREIFGFQSKVDILVQEWRQVKKSVLGTPKAREVAKRGDTTPLEGYFEMIKKVLEKMGGEAKRGELEKEFEAQFSGQLKPDDFIPVRGMARWKRKIRLAKKPMIQAGMVEKLKGQRWKLCSASAQPVIPT